MGSADTHIVNASNGVSGMEVAIHRLEGELHKSRQRVIDVAAANSSLSTRIRELNGALEGTRQELHAALRSVERLNKSNLAILSAPHFVINENSDKQRQLREQADSWIAVHDQLCAPEKDLRNLNIPASCGRNIAVGKIRELQRKAAILDRINAGDFR